MPLGDQLRIGERRGIYLALIVDEVDMVDWTYSGQDG